MVSEVPAVSVVSVAQWRLEVVSLVPEVSEVSGV